MEGRPAADPFGPCEVPTQARWRRKSSRRTDSIGVPGLPPVAGACCSDNRKTSAALSAYRVTDASQSASLRALRRRPSHGAARAGCGGIYAATTRGCTPTTCDGFSTPPSQRSTSPGTRAKPWWSRRRRSDHAVSTTDTVRRSAGRNSFVRREAALGRDKGLAGAPWITRGAERPSREEFPPGSLVRRRCCPLLRSARIFCGTLRGQGHEGPPAQLTRRLARVDSTSPNARIRATLLHTPSISCHIGDAPARVQPSQPAPGSKIPCGEFAGLAVRVINFRQTAAAATARTA